MQKNYQFDTKRHIHTLNGKPLTGVTSVLSVVSKGDGLIQWSANEAVKYITENLPKAFTYPLDNNNFEKLFNEAKIAWKNTRDTAGEQGTDIHETIEQIIKRAIALDGKILPLEAEVYADNQQVTNFINWAIENDVKFLASEKNIYSESLWIGGIVDFVYERDGQIYIGDIKTSKSIYPTYFWQTSAYKYCLEEMGLYKNIKGFTIVRIGKDGSFEVKENFSYEDNIDGFKSALTIYRKLNAITPPKKKIIKKVKK